MRKRSAFTLIELLVVIAIISLLLAILVPSLNVAREHAKCVKCKNQVRQIGYGLMVYADKNDGKLPMHDVSAYTCLWDLATPTIDAISANIGGTDPCQFKELFYCPSASKSVLTKELKELYWTPYESGRYDYRVVGYFFLLKRPSGFPQPNLFGSKQLVDNLSMANASRAELITDMVNSETMQGTKRFTYVEHVPGQPLPTNHLRGNKPHGGHILFVDQHLEWREFNEMKERAFGDTARIRLWF